ncbi:MAG: hypothetical protein KF716_11300 [Anaerolineae bacterium]|nr:hypothetical protein [Anaerolineae bacterium]
MRRLLIVILGSVLIAVALIASTIGIGRAMPLPTRIEEFRLDQCALPCWLQIEVGKTTVAEAKRLLTKNFPKPKYKIEYASVIIIRDRLTDEVLMVLLNDAGDPATQRDTGRVINLDLWLGDKHPLTASELFGLIGEPDSIGMIRQSVRLQGYVLYCGLQLRATSLMTGFDVSSPDSDMGRIEAMTPTQDVCNTEFGYAWEGYTPNYRRQLVEITNRYMLGN